MDQDTLKRRAAEQAVTYVQDGMTVGLGTGSTARHMIAVLGERVAAGLHIRAVSTSERSAAQARALGIVVLALDDVPGLDLTIDGADEVDLATFGVIKGLGGALLREKIVARASATEIIIVDESKVVLRLGTHTPVPVEVVRFGWQHTAARLAALGCTPQLRLVAADGAPYATDEGHYVLDCGCGPLADPPGMEQAMKQITGVVECGLFLGLVGRIIVAGSVGVQVYDHPAGA